MKRLCPICFRDVDEAQPFLTWCFGTETICGHCRKQFIEADPPMYEIHGLPIYAFYRYDDALENLLYQYKEGRDVALAEVFLGNVKQKLIDKTRHKVLVPMPSSEGKLKERRFNHLKRMLTGIDVEICDCLIKTSEYKQSLHRGKARQKVREVIALNPAVEIPNCPLILFDDVCTSGSTLSSAYDLLHKTHADIEAVVLCVHPHFVEICDEMKLSEQQDFSILKMHWKGVQACKEKLNGLIKKKGSGSSSVKMKKNILYIIRKFVRRALKS